jgi:hypothetical protein
LSEEQLEKRLLASNRGFATQIGVLPKAGCVVKSSLVATGGGT